MGLKGGLGSAALASISSLFSSVIKAPSSLDRSPFAFSWVGEESDRESKDGKCDKAVADLEAWELSRLSVADFSHRKHASR